MTNHRRISFQYENTLLLNRKKLQAADIAIPSPDKISMSAAELGQLLMIGRVATRITSQMDMIYDKARTHAHDPSKIVRPAIWLAQLSAAGDMENRSVVDPTIKVLQGTIVNAEGDRNATAMVVDPAPLLPVFREYWDRVADTGFVPEVDHYGSMGLWLRIRTPRESDDT